MARTIDNLGVESSSRYAADRAAYDESFEAESRYVPSQVRVTSTSRHAPLEFDALFALNEGGASWATFNSPIGFAATRRRVFAEQVLPQMGTPEKRDAQMEKLKAYGKQEKLSHPEESETIEKEKEALLSLLTNMGTIDQLLFDINSRRVQYQKG